MEEEKSPGNMLDEFINGIRREVQMARSQEAMARDRTPEEAIMLSMHIGNACVEVANRDKNVQSLMFFATPFGADSEGNDIGSFAFASCMLGGVSRPAFDLIVREHIPSAIKDMQPSFWSRLKTCWFILRASPERRAKTLRG